MKLRNIASNMTEVETSNGTRILFSYATPVAAWVPRGGYIRTSNFYSATTTRHINKWIDGTDYHLASQQMIDDLADDDSNVSTLLAQLGI